MHKWRYRKWQKKFLAIAIACLLVILGSINSLSQPISDSLPPLQAHPLPKFLVAWQDRSDSGDYFEQVSSTPLGYLVWTHFPVTVYIETPSTKDNTASNLRFQQWVTTVRQAIAEWNTYFPLQEIADKSAADIVILRSPPKREAKLNPETRLYDLPRAIAAQTNYEFYLQNQQQIIALRMTVKIAPSSVGQSLLATVRHELGHALGIWGHSPEASDALYYSQVRDPLPISSRDINTLKKVYQQPTRLGWKL